MPQRKAAKASKVVKAVKATRTAKAASSVAPSASGPGNWSASSIPSTPFMEPAGIKLLKKRLAGVRTYLEYGSGGSTVMAAKADIRRIYSVDTDKQFLGAVRRRLVDEGLPRRRHVPVYVDIGPTGAWGRPRDESHATQWPRYCGEPWRKLRTAGDTPELILIDGRFRVAAFLMSVLMAQPGCVVLFDDYFIRPYYHVVEQHLAPSRQAGRMAEFIVQPLADREQALFDLLAYSTDSR
ncbi:hypothetical protein [Bordetella petrii]|uniref:hypothetical protein n=1 Tax=Bordetella petrii TaxID=94624 RepID=UPI001E35FB0E|nr:hypothetical protein [Bordetella petrii]MCD0503489.1 hypothetical protein [Bordetella petrii]